jgi:uncharacterized membrane protein YccC
MLFGDKVFRSGRNLKTKNMTILEEFRAEGRAEGRAEAFTKRFAMTLAISFADGYDIGRADAIYERRRKSELIEEIHQMQADFHLLLTPWNILYNKSLDELERIFFEFREKCQSHSVG